MPTEPKKIKQTISRYKNSMHKEKINTGGISDGYGKRFILFSLYFLLGDNEGALEYFDWYKNEFPDCSGDPEQLLVWALLLQRAGKHDQAMAKLGEAMLSNLYLIPFLLDRVIKEHDMWHSSNTSSVSYVYEISEEVLDRITDNDKSWLAKQYDSTKLSDVRSAHIEIYHQLSYTEGYEKRHALVEKERVLLAKIHSWSKVKTKVVDIRDRR